MQKFAKDIYSINKHHCGHGYVAAIVGLLPPGPGFSFDSPEKRSLRSTERAA